MENILFKILVVVLAVNIFTIGVFLVFLINLRINVVRRIKRTRFYVDIFNAAKNENSTDDAAKSLNMEREEFLIYCEEANITLPEQRVNRLAKIQKRKEEEQYHIKEEEDSWRVEQQRLNEERQKAVDEEAKKRKERLRKFGFK